MLDALHRAQGPELRAFLDSLPIAAGDRVLDLACGDGAFTTWIAERAGPNGLAIGLDASQAYLDSAATRLDAEATERAALTLFARGDAAALPFPDGSFDLGFCAHSLQSLPDPVAAVRELARVIRPGGHLAILENDELSHVILPWPPEVDLAIDRGLALAAARRHDSRPFVGRRLGKILGELGLRLVRFDTITVSRCGPLSPADREYFIRFLEHRRARVEPNLAGDERALALAYLSPAGIRSLADDPGLTVAFVHVAAVAEKR